MEKAYLINVGKISMRVYNSLARSETMSLQFKEQQRLEVEKGFQYCHVTPYRDLLDVPVLFKGDNYLLNSYIFHPILTTNSITRASLSDTV